MKRYVWLLLAVTLAGCVFPPKPQAVRGEYRPINKQITPPASRQIATSEVFDFQFEGDIVNALFALQAIQPQINVMPPLGKGSPLPVRVEVRGGVLEDALQAIGEQGANVADVVWLPDGNRAFIRFRAHTTAN